eukprot:2003860-Prymnesium_polylepis.1
MQNGPQEYGPSRKYGSGTKYGGHRIRIVNRSDTTWVPGTVSGWLLAYARLRAKDVCEDGGNHGQHGRCGASGCQIRIGGRCSAIA